MTSTGGKVGIRKPPSWALTARASRRLQGIDAASVTALKAAPWQKGLDGWSMLKRVGAAHGAVRDDVDGG
jgi:hypothetical protein